jgi:lactoylglutathione lyase
MQLAVLSHAKSERALAAAVPDDQGTHASQTTYTPGMALIHTCYRITDIDRSVAFYRALGFEEVGRIPIRDEAVNVFMNQSGDGDMPRLELTYNIGVDSYDLGTGYGHIAITAENLDATLDRLAEQGIEPERPPYSVHEGGSRLAFVRDPDGYRIELIEQSRA